MTIELIFILLPSKEDRNKILNAYRLTDLLDLARNEVESSNENLSHSASDQQNSGQKLEPNPQLSSTSLERIYENLSRYLEDLLELEELLQSAAAEHEESANISQNLASTVFEVHEFYTNLIKARFPEANSALVQRLGQVNWIRKQRLQQNMEAVEEEEQEEQEQEHENKSVVARSQFHDSGLGSSLPNQQSYAMSVVSFFSSADGETRARIPRLSEAAKKGSPFVCDGCGVRIVMQDDYKWK